MVRAMLVAVALALASADPEQASLLQTHPARAGSPSLKDTDLMALLDSLIANPQSIAKELVGAEPSVQQALVQRANEKPRRLQLLHRVLELPTNEKLELLQAAKTSPDVGHLFRSLSQQTHLNLIEMSKASSVDAAMASKDADGDWLDLSAKNVPEATTQAPEETPTTQAPEETPTTQAPEETTPQCPVGHGQGLCDQANAQASCYIEANGAVTESGEELQCLEGEDWREYECPSALPDKCKF